MQVSEITTPIAADMALNGNLLMQLKADWPYDLDSVGCAASLGLVSDRGHLCPVKCGGLPIFLLGLSPPVLLRQGPQVSVLANNRLAGVEWQLLLASLLVAISGLSYKWLVGVSGRLLRVVVTVKDAISSGLAALRSAAGELVVGI